MVLRGLGGFNSYLRRNERVFCGELDIEAICRYFERKMRRGTEKAKTNLIPGKIGFDDLISRTFFFCLLSLLGKNADHTDAPSAQQRVALAHLRSRAAPAAALALLPGYSRIREQYEKFHHEHPEL